MSQKEAGAQTQAGVYKASIDTTIPSVDLHASSAGVHGPARTVLNLESFPQYTTDNRIIIYQCSNESNNEI